MRKSVTANWVEIKSAENKVQNPELSTSLVVFILMSLQTEVKDHPVWE